MAVLGMHDCYRNFPQAFVGRTEHAHFGDLGAGVELGLDFRRRDVLAAPDDDLFLAIDDEQISVVVEVADVARADESIWGKKSRGRFGIGPIALDIGSRSNRDL